MARQRPKERNLVRWTDDMDVQLLLIVQQVCNQKHIQIPWTEVGSTLGPTISGGAVIQHLAKLRKRREAAGLPNPEPLRRSGSGPTGTKLGNSRPSIGKAKKIRGEKVSNSQQTSNSNDDYEGDIDVDKVSDPDESFGETRLAKRSKSLTKTKDFNAKKRDKGKGKSPTTIKKEGSENSSDSQLKRRYIEAHPDSSRTVDKEHLKSHYGFDNAKRVKLSESSMSDENEESRYDLNERYVGAGADWIKLTDAVKTAASIASSRAQTTDEDDEDVEGEGTYGGYGDGVDETLSLTFTESQKASPPSKIIVLRIRKSQKAQDVPEVIENSAYFADPRELPASAAVSGTDLPQPVSNHHGTMVLHESNMSTSLHNGELESKYGPYIPSYPYSDEPEPAKSHTDSSYVPVHEIHRHEISGYHQPTLANSYAFDQLHRPHGSGSLMYNSGAQLHGQSQFEEPFLGNGYIDHNADKFNVFGTIEDNEISNFASASDIDEHNRRLQFRQYELLTSSQGDMQTYPVNTYASEYDLGIGNNAGDYVNGYQGYDGFANPEGSQNWKFDLSAPGIQVQKPQSPIPKDVRAHGRYSGLPNVNLDRMFLTVSEPSVPLPSI